ncbi:MAG: hypothetical protein N2448_06460 [Caloramator sp.]|nr:hypothetical protein [Caloramator sp.]
MGIKNVRIDYFRVCCREYDQERNTVSNDLKLFDLAGLLSVAITRTSAENTYTFGGEDARLQLIEKETDSPYWKMQFLRIRKDVLPGIATDGGEYTMLDLDDDEWVGEEVSVLYDETLHTIAVQRNRNSLGISGIEGFFNYVMNDPQYIIQFCPIPVPDELRQLRTGEYFKKIMLSFAETALDKDILPKNSSLYKIIKGVEGFGAINVNITMSIGRGKGNINTLDEQEVLRLMDLKGINGFSKIEIYKKPHEDAKIEVIDLIEGKLYDVEKMEYGKDNPIQYNRVINVMKSKYEERIPFLRELFGIND